MGRAKRLSVRGGGSEAHAVIQRSRQSRHAPKEQAPADQAAAVAPPAQGRQVAKPSLTRGDGRGWLSVVHELEGDPEVVVLQRGDDVLEGVA